MLGIALEHSLPSWVEPDPLRGRATDALGLQKTADAISDALLPGLSVATRRARYYSLLCWARRICGKTVDEDRIHRLEVALAVREAILHPRDLSGDPEATECQFVGSRNLPRAPNALNRPPRNPRNAYKTPVWRAYRASMQSLHLINESYSLTDDHGVALAKAFVAACRPDSSGTVMLPKSACLSRLSYREGILLQALLGIRKKGKLGLNDSSPEGRRGAAERTLRELYDRGVPLGSMLRAYEARPDREPIAVVAALREAAIWERLSVGLHATFLLWLRHIRHPQRVRSLILTARRKRIESAPPFAAIDIDDNTAVNSIHSVRRALALRDRLAAKRSQLNHCDDGAFELGAALVGSTPIDDVLAQFEQRHEAAKGDDAWIRPAKHGKELARDAHDKWQVPTKATLHSYRLMAFGRILADLQEARR